MWYEDSMIPFFETPQAKQFDEWISNWNQSKPACILFGPTSSGKTRLYETKSFAYKLHIIEVDCSSASSLREVLAAADEATQSRTVGCFFGVDQVYTEISSMVVLEHIDALFSPHGTPTPALIKFCQTARVPLVLTSYINLFKPEQWLLPIKCERIQSPINILLSSPWLRGKSHFRSIRRDLQNLFSYTGDDIRQTAINYQVSRTSDNFLSRQERIYYSIPSAADKKRTNSQKWHMASELLDALLVISPDDQFFDDFIYPVESLPISKKHKMEVDEILNFSKSIIPHVSFGDEDAIDMAELLYEACKNSYYITRTRIGAPIGDGNRLSPSNINYVLSWNLWEWETMEQQASPQPVPNVIQLDNAQQMALPAEWIQILSQTIPIHQDEQQE